MDESELAWPEEGDLDEDFGARIAEALEAAGYCLVRTALSDEDKEQALSVAKKNQDFQEYKAELEVDYMGKNNSTKAAKLPVDSPERDPMNALAFCDRQLTLLGLALAPFTEAALGFAAFGRSPGLVRTPYSSSAEASRMRPAPIVDEDVEENVVGNYITWLQSRKVCMIYFVAGDGEVVLYPKEGSEIVIRVSTPKVLIFMHDHMSYKYVPEKSSLALQSWMMSPVQNVQLDKLQATSAEKDEMMHITGPARRDDRKMQILSMQARFPGETNGRDAYWSLTSLCTDACLTWPVSRMDMDIYYSDNPDAALMGRSYTQHGGFITLSQLYGFDNSFFGISEEYASCMSTNQRMTCEVFYETLNLAGWTKKSVNGKHIGMFLGDVGPDWHSLTSYASLAVYHPEHTASAITSALAPARLHHIFNMIGPTMTFDTACSASLVATHHCHMETLNWYENGDPDDGSMCGGVNTLDAIGYVGNCSANMLSHVGRSHTFDRTADGYQRGEGCGAMFLKLSQEYEDIENRLAMLAGSCANQDGKSASLTAPNGPSQQAVLRKSLAFAEIEPSDVTVVECHGTGTALGDPIEVGAVLAVMEGERDDPLPHTSAKSNIAHLESAAGIAGLLKCLIILRHSGATPNVHLKALNPHLESAGFPQAFESEILDTNLNSGYTGVSSFGFGGTNSRGDLYSKAHEGPRAKATIDVQMLDFITVPCPRCLGPMSWPDGAAVPSRTTKGRHHPSLVREDGDYTYCTNCYDKPFRFGEMITDLDAWNMGESVYIKGSWTGWSTLDEMEMVEDGVYVTYITLGDGRWEEFQLVVNQNVDETIYPIMRKAGPSIRIRGPDFEKEAKGHNWLIDGRAEAVPAGTIYKIVFEWGETSKKISWEKVPEVPPLTEPLGLNFQHGFHITGTWTRWKVEEMTRVEGETECFEAQFRVGPTGLERFQILRDRDESQTIYPLEDKAEEASIPVRGPDDCGAGKAWLVRGAARELVTVRVRLVDGQVSVTATSSTVGEKTWASTTEMPANIYYVTGSFNGWGLDAMLPDESNPGVHRLSMSMADRTEEEFQIVLNGNPNKVLHPVVPSAGLFEAIMLDPDDEGEGKNWLIQADYGAVLEIMLDLNELDRRKMVSWVPVGAPLLEEAPAS